MIDIYDIIACPICKGRLLKTDQRLCCAEHGEYNISKGGVPILFKNKVNDEIFKDGETAYQDEKKNKQIVYLKKKIFRKPKMYFGASLHDRLKKEYIINSSKDKIILNIGSGHAENFHQDNLINFDIYPHWNTHVSGDAHYLPFLNSSVDIVWLCAVLEHIENPFRVIDEVYRVLKPDGILLISVPFIQYLHASPHDYFRYTKYGLRSVCRNFREIESGATYTGPMGTVLQLISVVPLILFKNKIIKNTLSFITAWIFSPILLLDLFLRTKRSEIVTGGICYLGKKT